MALPGLIRPLYGRITDTLAKLTLTTQWKLLQWTFQFFKATTKLHQNAIFCMSTPMQKNCLGFLRPLMSLRYSILIIRAEICNNSEYDFFEEIPSKLPIKNGWDGLRRPSIGRNERKSSFFQKSFAVIEQILSHHLGL